MERKIAFEVVLFVLSSYISSLLYGTYLGLQPSEIMPWLIYQVILAGGGHGGKFVLSAGIGGVFFCAANILIIFDPRAKDARFAKYGDLKKGGLLSGRGVVLGRWHNKLLTSNDHGHTLIAAPTRSGKGVGVVIPNLLYWGASAIVMDIKGENFKLTSGYRAKNGQRILRFAPKDESRQTHCFNPFDFIRFGTDNEIDDMQLLASQLFPLPKSGETFWCSQSQELFIGIGFYLHSLPTAEKTLGAVFRFIEGSEDLPRHIKECLSRNDNLHPICISKFKNFLGKSDKEQSGVNSTMNDHLKVWGEPKLDAAMSKSDFTFEDFRKRPTTLYICINYGDIGRLAPVLNFFFQMSFAALASREFDEKKEEEILFLLDEFPSLGAVKIIKERISDLAGYGIRIMAIIQDLNQLKTTYGNNETSTILSNCHVKAFFSVEDPDTQKYLSERLGKKTVKKRSKSYKQGKDIFDAPTVSISSEKVALMGADDIAGLGNDKIIILKTGARPVMAKRISYFNDKKFKDNVLPPVAIKP